MEEDNAHDVFKFILNKVEDVTNDSAIVNYKGAKFEAKLSLLGNILCCNAVDEAQVPLIFVLEQVSVKTLPQENGFPMELVFASSSENLTVTFHEEQLREQYLVKIATSAHQMALAELDEMAYRFYTMSTEDSPSSSVQLPPFVSYFLTAPQKAVHNFAISQQNNLPARRLAFEEVAFESKLSLILPMELLKSYRKWWSEFCCLLESRQHFWPAFALSTLHDMLRELRENLEVYEQCHEFLTNYAGPSFKTSKEKFRVAFAMVPTNLHVHSYGLTNDRSFSVLSVGTASALPLRFQNGGLSRQMPNLAVDAAFHDAAFFAKRQLIIDQKKEIGDINRKVESDWSKASTPQTACMEMCTSIKQVFEVLKDCCRFLSGADQCSELLVEEAKKRGKSNGSTTFVIEESVQNQLDCLDATLISLNTKMAALDSFNESKSDREVYEKCVRDAMSSCLDRLLTLADSILECQLLGLALAISRGGGIRGYMQLQLRIDIVLSQAITIAVTAIANAVREHKLDASTEVCDMLLVVFSFLSIHGDERGMAEDAVEGWRLLHNRVTFQLVRAVSEVSRVCIPMIGGSRTAMKVSIPLPHDVFDQLPKKYKQSSFKVTTAYFNIGVNHEATLGQSFGGVAFESQLNKEAVDNVLAFANRTAAASSAREAVLELVNTVTEEASRKNMLLFEWAMTACERLSGHAVICCKSGKDRTGMAVTIEQGRVLRETCGLNVLQVSEVIASLRRDGLRRENCRKNVGKAMFSFSPFQMHFLPKSFRPPSGTYAQGISS